MVATASGTRPGSTRVTHPVTDALFVVFLIAYTLVSLASLAAGATAFAAARSVELHDTLHSTALRDDVLARVASGVATTSHNSETPIQFAIDYSFSTFSLAIAGFLLWLRRHDRAARLLALGAIGTAALFNLQANSVFEVMPFNRYDSLARFLFQLAAGLAYIYAMLLFPDGLLVPRRAGWVLALVYLPLTAGTVFITYRLAGTTHRAFIILFFGIVTPLAGVVSQGYRYRRSFIVVERQQARLLFWALTPALVLALFALLGGVGGDASSGLEGRPLSRLPVAFFRVFSAVFALMPLGLFLGLIRFRLWDIDRVINRTLVYGLVTAALGLAYTGGVVFFQWVFSPFTRGSDIAVAGSTLLAAFLFRPLRDRIRSFIDKRFYRYQYDLTRCVDDFSARLRHEADIRSVQRQLRRVIGETVRPAHMSLWLKQAEER